MKLLVFIIFIVILNGNNAARRKGQQQCDLKKMDKKATVVFVFGRRDVYLPKNPKEMVPHCKEEFEAEDYVKSYAKRCLRPFPRQIIGVILLGASQVIRTRCTPEGTREYLSHYKCIKTAIPSLHDCMDQLVITLQMVANKPGEERIPQACCSFSRYIQCSVKAINKHCPGDKKAEEYIAVKMIKGYASEVLDLACQGYEIGSDKCNKLILPDGGFEEVNMGLKLVRNITGRPLSLIPPFIEIFTRS